MREIAKNHTQREPRLMALAVWGHENLLARAHALGAIEPRHYLLPLCLSKSRDADEKKESLIQPSWVSPLRSFACELLVISS